MRRPPALLSCLILPASLLLLVPSPALARDALGVFSGWAAFRDPAIPRCYAIAQPDPLPAQADYPPFAALGTWPRRGIHTALHLRLSHRLAPNAQITLNLAGSSLTTRRYHLVGGDGDAWPATPRDDAAITAALRSANTLSVTGRTRSGRLFTDSYPLAGAATAMDAAALGCANLK